MSADPLQQHQDKDLIIIESQTSPQVVRGSGATRSAPLTAATNLRPEHNEHVVDLTIEPGSPDIEVITSTVRPDIRRPIKKLQRNVKAIPTKRQYVRPRSITPPPPSPPPPDSPAGPKCGICLEPMGGNTNRSMAAGNCGHVYCKDCLFAAVKTTKKCPTCRKSLQMRNLHPVFVQF